MMELTRRAAFGFLAGWTGASGKALAQQAPNHNINIGAIYPLSGRDAVVGQNANLAFRVMLEIVHGDYDLDLPMARTDHLPRLPGARLRHLIADHRGDPGTARLEAEKLIATGKVVALIGAGDERIADAVAGVAERAGIPFLDTDSASPRPGGRGSGLVFRFAPGDENRVATLVEFLGHAGQSGGPKIRSIAMLHDKEPEDVRLANMLRAAATAAGMTIAVELPYIRGNPALAAEALAQTRAAPDCVVMIGPASDAAGLPNPVSHPGARPAVVCLPSRIADRVQGPVPAARGAFMVKSFARDTKANNPNIAAINTLYRSYAKKDLDGPTAIQFTASLTLAFAINESRNASGAAIAEKIASTRFPGDRTIMPWSELRFDPAGMNVGAAVIVAQRIEDRLNTVFPDQHATAVPVWKA